MRIIDDMTVPARHARACVVDKGQILRIHQVEGEQVGDCAFFNADNVKEQFHVGQSWALNVMLGTGTAKAFTHFYSNPPYENVMLTVVDDTVRTHFGNCAGRCSTKLLQMRDDVQGGRSCQENLAEALAPYGLLGEDIHDVFNVFMNVDLFVDGGFRVKPPLARKGDYIDLKAEMTILAAVSACPNTSNPVNNYNAKPLGLTVYEPTT
ncbi:MAG: urea carboxylase-associated family protein [Devosia sp.]